MTPGFSVELFDSALQSRGTTPVDTSPLIIFFEGLFDYQGEPVRRAVITFNNPAAASRFALDNLILYKARERLAGTGNLPVGTAA
ncbi:MAG: hypothetical protein H0T92_17740 [Pyrinomonadaceae bacterium]|nr:hypothetical protein [Pyrinomonadaceae bacterium]